MAATQEFVASRLFPTEQEVAILKTSVTELRESLEALRVQVQSRDADWASAEKRIEEVNKIVEQFEADRPGNPFDKPDDAYPRKANELLRNPAFRQLFCYTGEHKQYSKWRSKVKAILVGEDEHFRTVLKTLESPEQQEIPPEAEGTSGYAEQVRLLSLKVGVESQVLVRMAAQMQCILTNYCEDTALAIIDSLEEHGQLSGFEGWRRLYSEQRGTLNQRTDLLRERVLYPERTQQVADIMNAITPWEKHTMSSQRCAVEHSA